MRVQKNPAPGTLATIWKDGVALPTDSKTGTAVVVEEMTQAQFDAWLAEQPAPPEPPLPVPSPLPAWRIRAVLRRHELLDTVEAMIAQLPEPPRIIVEEQMKSSSFERNHPVIEQFGAALGLTSAQLDDIFREADALV